MSSIVASWPTATAATKALLNTKLSGGMCIPHGLCRVGRLTWEVGREVAVGALIDGAGPAKILLLGPRPDAGPGASAACAALENLARTLSVEWARHEVTAVMVAPGASTSEAELADLICFLCSRAGDYFSGCRLSLGQ